MELKSHLAPLVRNGRIVVMDNYAVKPGEEWSEKIGEMLEQSDIVLLLLSADSLSSDHFYRETKIAIERRRQGRTEVIPIKLRTCDLEDEPLLKELEHIEVLPLKDKPVVKWEHRDDAYQSIVRGLKKVLETLISSLPPRAQRQQEYADLAAQADTLYSKKQWQAAFDAYNLALELWESDFPDTIERLQTRVRGCQIGMGQVRKKQKEAAENTVQITQDQQLRVDRFSQNDKKDDPFADLMIPIKGGTFEMGDTFGDGTSWEKPVHRVTIKDFYLCKYLVTQSQWGAIMGYNPSNYKYKGGDLPVETVSWKDAQVFIKKLNEKTGKQYRLPSEAEWEYAAREGGKKVRFGNGKNIADPKEINFNSSKQCKQSYSVVGEYSGAPTSVTTFAPNALGLHDMSGNVYEWCQDVWHDKYKGAPNDGSAWEQDGDDSLRVIRGGSVASSLYCRAAFRHSHSANDRSAINGFRLAL